MTIIGNKLKVLEYLQRERYAAKNKRTVIKKSKFYADFSRGIFVCRDENQITDNEILAYVHTAGLIRLDGNALNLDRLREEEISTRR